MSTLTIDGDQVQAISPEGQKATVGLGDFMKKILPTPPPILGTIMPDGFKTSETKGVFTTCVFEFPPRVYHMRWIDDAKTKVPYGSGATYKTVKLAVPYLLILPTFVMDQQGRMDLTWSSECFFRTAPLTSLDDEILYPGLLNCSHWVDKSGKLLDGKPLSWICTQYLNRAAYANETDPNRRLRGAIKALWHCLLETGFNYSSEHHEPTSHFTASKGIDARISTVEKWQAASEKDPLFVLDVPWRKTGKTLRQVLEHILNYHKAQPPVFASSADLARVVFNHKKS